jgi:RNA polymerase sigma factor (sigma-70 family)
MSEEPTFKELIDRVRAGDNEAVRELIREYEPELRRMIRYRLTDRRLRRQFDSSDVCQSVLADFFVGTALGQFDLEEPRHLIGLLVTMARNRLTNHAKKQQARRRDVRQELAVDAAMLDPPDPRETPSEIVLGRDLIEQFKARLTPAERQIAARRAAGESWAEIGKATGETPDAVRMHFTRAVSRVKKELGFDDAGEEE